MKTKTMGFTATLRAMTKTELAERVLEEGALVTSSMTHEEMVQAVIHTRRSVANSCGHASRKAVVRAECKKAAAAIAAVNAVG